MRRDPARLGRHAALVAADLTGTLDGAWSCTVSEDFVLRVIGPRWHGVVELDPDLDPDDEEALPASDQDSALDDDASETVAEQVVELLGNTRVEWPVCPAHGSQLMTCSGVWVCNEGRHDPAVVGQLGDARAADRDA